MVQWMDCVSDWKHVKFIRTRNIKGVCVATDILLQGAEICEKGKKLYRTNDWFLEENSETLDVRAFVKS